MSPEMQTLIECEFDMILYRNERLRDLLDLATRRAAQGGGLWGEDQDDDRDAREARAAFALFPPKPPWEWWLTVL